MLEAEIPNLRAKTARWRIFRLNNSLALKDNYFGLNFSFQLVSTLIFRLFKLKS